ncbi:MAG TPA: penicillin-binding transpeptidase domain-containing protein [Candidatus Acidoferrum sp.]|nr:penicillin-binding transpeptidase domain-containing protein [Candidatus Acidoferrum sp.]
MRIAEAGRLSTLLAVVLVAFYSFPLRSRETSLAALLQLQVNRAMEKVPGAFVVVEIDSRSVLAAHRMDLASRQMKAPGSTLKPFLLMALLESGKLDPNQKLICRKPLKIGSAQMDCTHPSQVKELDATSAIAYSCNSYVAEVALRLNGSELVGLLRRAGFDSPSGLVDREARGRIETPSTQEDLQLEALGYRGIEVTPLELLEAYRRLALRKRQEDLGVDASVFQGLEDSVAFGMAHAAFVDGMKIAGKTGTSVARNTQQTHGYFVGYAPAEKPQIVLVVYLAQGRGQDAAAVAQPVLEAFAKFRDKS